MTGMAPSKVFFTKGVGMHKEKLQSLELALRKAGIEKCNIVRVSSIFPPYCKIISRKKGLALLMPGEITYCVLAHIETNEPDRLMSAAIGVAVPASHGHYGYISEHHAYGLSAQKTSDYVEDLAATMLASSLGIDFNPEEGYDERREIYRMSGKIVETKSITQTARGNKRGKWTVAVAAAVFL